MMGDTCPAVRLYFVCFLLLIGFWSYADTKKPEQENSLGTHKIPCHQREQILLDGTWEFTLDPNGQGANEKWYTKSDCFTHRITVPGCWNAEAFGPESKKLKHEYVGKAWYRKEVVVPETWQDKQIFLCFGGVHRYARIWIDEQYVGEHLGYLSPFEFEVTNVIKPGQKFIVSVEVDSKLRPDIDQMQGAADLIDYMWTPWGGISGHVTMEARPETWIRSVFIRSLTSPTKGCGINIALAGAKVDTSLKFQVEIMDAGGQVVEKGLHPCHEYLNENHEMDYTITLDEASLWSPESPYLYTARVSLLDGNKILDVWKNRFGIRDIQICGSHFLVNGAKYFLRGYGDDSVFPETFMPPVDKEFYRKRLELAKEYGFNFVRNHSAIFSQEYYDACDEIGMFVSAEFPIGYQRFYDRASPAALQTYEREWTATIQKLRNHPSIFNWCMGNEMWNGVPLSPAWYKIAKDLDPDRLVVDSDGLFAPGFVDGTQDRPTLDFYYIMFNVWSSVLDNPEKFKTGIPKKPIISHENGNFVTFPDLAQVSLFQHNFKPFWLLPVKERLEQWGLYSESTIWAEKSEKLYHFLHKMDIEALRKNPNISGYHWWLVQDYWTTSNGLVNLYWKPKSILPERVKSFNAPVVLLQDGLQNTYQANDQLKLFLKMSNYSESKLSNFTFRWTLRLPDRVIDQNQMKITKVDQGSLETLAEIEVNLPDLEKPSQLELRVEALTEAGTFANRWTTWLYPKALPVFNKSVPIYISKELMENPAWSMLEPDLIPESEELPVRALYILRQPNLKILQALENGASVLLISPERIFETDTIRFKSAWWNGGVKGDRSAGTVVYNYDFLREIAPEGWCDSGWFHLLEGAQTYILDDLFSQTEIMVRSIDVPFVMSEPLEKELDPDFGQSTNAEYFMKNKAVLFQARVNQGRLMVSGFNFAASSQKNTPEGEWLFHQLVDFTLHSAMPRAEWNGAYLRAKIPD